MSFDKKLGKFTIKVSKFDNKVGKSLDKKVGKKSNSMDFQNSEKAIFFKIAFLFLFKVSK